MITTQIDLNHDKERIAKTLYNFFRRIDVMCSPDEVECEFATHVTRGGPNMKVMLGKASWLIINLSDKYKDKVTIIYDPISNKIAYEDKYFLNKINKKQNKNNMRIRFKDVSEIDLSKVFPSISEEEYSIIADQEITLDNRSYTKLKNDLFINLSGFKVSLDLIEVFEEEAVSLSQQNVHNVVEEKFIFSESVVDILMAGIENNKNVILYGRGGHGKSEMTELVLKTLYENGTIKNKPFVQALGDGITEDKLFGGTNIVKYREKGLIEYLPENSFMNHEIVVFEEIFDAPASVLLSLKDIMTSKQFRQGNETFDVKTKVYIGLTNKSKETFSEDSDSLKALAERFPLTLKVEWDTYTKGNFISLFKKVLGVEFYKKHNEKLVTLCDIIHLNNTNGVTFVSPRTAIAAAEVYCKGKPLEYISEIDKTTLSEYNSKIKDDYNGQKQSKLLRNIEDYINKHELEVIGQTEEFLDMLNEIEEETTGKSLDLKNNNIDTDSTNKAKLIKLNYILSIVDRISPTKQHYSKFTDIKKRIKKTVTELGTPKETKEKQAK